MKSISVSVVGLGQMGSALVAPFLRGGNKVTVWNRSAEKAKPLVALGAELAGNIEEAINASELIVVCLSDYGTSDALFRTPEIERLLKGKTLLQLTTGTGDEAARSAIWANDIGMNYLDGAIMDYPRAIGTQECMLLASGPEASYKQYADYFHLLGGAFTYVGKNPAAANHLDGGLLTMYYATTFGFLQSAAMLQAADVSVDTLKHAVDSFRHVLDKSVAKATDAISRNDYAGNEASIVVHSYGVQSLRDRAKSAGVEYSLLQLFSDYLEKTKAKGFEAAELPAAFEVIRRM
ncbi:NAD(P)-dependent oxidoreductase [Paraburkholderia aspalathi]|uniref:NAD binding domain of 6-phosphogluconate dehydrogenase n=1 Tax=Paraburkholderia aspalathi TaxID=1324617 RepID=A0A1I7E9G8_9BURK|nr:NAD(P)-binding domain-containing protein [Paraburkholderia aspalathi]SFU20581.1 NAD binding domain of 6-phosphogluconate dehydrogenase [Paraburkholderia aspalathi]